VFVFVDYNLSLNGQQVRCLGFYAGRSYLALVKTKKTFDLISFLNQPFD
jgi:hypothetical protein